MARALWLLLAALCPRLPRATGAGLRASVASSLPGRGVEGQPAAPGVFGFETSEEDFYEHFQLELRVVFQPSPDHGHAAVLDGAPIEGCEGLLLEVGDGFPSPLNCHSGDFSGEGNSTAQRFFSIRFGLDRTLRRASSYRFVVPGLRLLLGGPLAGGRANFSWRFELRLASGMLMENATATLEHDVGDQLDNATIEEFLVEGGKDMLPGALRGLRLSLRAPLFPDEGALLVAFLPLLLWDQLAPDCALAPGSTPGNCTYARAGAGTGYNQLLIELTEPAPPDGELVFYVTVLAPSALGLLPTELLAAVLESGDLSAGPAAHGPFFEGSGSDAPPPIELYTRFAPVARVASASDRMEGARGNAVTLVLRPGAALLGRDLRGRPREVFLSVTASTFFRITSAATASVGAPFGTDHAPLLALSDDGRTAAFHFGGRRALALGNIEYSVQLLVENPMRYFWAIGGNEPWIVAVEQGPRQGCFGCPVVRYEGAFEGPDVDFAIRRFQVLPSSLLLGARTEVVFSFQLIYEAEQLVLLMPEGYEAQGCTFQSPISLEGRKRAFLQCLPENSTFRIVSQPPDRPLEPLPASQPLVFRGRARHPATATPGRWAARALGAGGSVVASTRREDEVQLLLFSRELPFFSVRTDDRGPNATAVVTVEFVAGVGLRPGDVVRVTAPAGFRWRFLASEFSSQPSGLGLEAALPVERPSADGSDRALELQVAALLPAGRAHGFSARVEHPAERPADYHWSLETFGPSAAIVESQRYEASTLEGYPISQLLDVSIWPWTQARSTAGPVTLAFTVTQAVEPAGSLVVRCPGDFAFESSCNISELRLDEGPDASALTLPAASVVCEAVTPSEVHIGLSDTGLEAGLRPFFLEAGARYALTLHSLANPVGVASLESLVERWRVETKDAAQQTLDEAPPVEGFVVGMELPYAELLPGGPSTGQDLTAGQLQWVTIAFKVAEPTQPKQRMTVFAAPGFLFEAFCHVRDPPLHTAPFAAPMGSQLSECRGLGASAQMQIEAVWEPRRTYAFQAQVRSALPSNEPAPELEAPFHSSWRLCFDRCKQGGLLRRPQRPPSLQALELAATSRIFGEQAAILIRFTLSTSMPPGGLLTVRAPAGHIFPSPCVAFASEPGGGHSALPAATACEAGPSPTGGLQPWELRLVLGPEEGHRLMAHKTYAFSVGLLNPDRGAEIDGFAWVVSTATAAGQLLDYTHTDDSQPVLGPTLLPLRSFPSRPRSPDAGEFHSLVLSFRVLASEEGGDESLVPFLTRLELHAPVDRGRGPAEGRLGEDPETSEWDLSSPAACTATFLGMDGQLHHGLRHANLTVPEGEAACLPEGRFGFSLTFRPSMMSPRVVTKLEFAVRNPQISPGPLWNRWRLRLARVQPRLAEEASSREVGFLAAQGALFMPMCEANLEGFRVIPAFLAVHLNPSSYAVNETSLVGVELQSRSDVPIGAVLVVSAPSGFLAMLGDSDRSTFSTNAQASPDLQLLPPAPGQQANRASVLFAAGHQSSTGPVRFTLPFMNPLAPTAGPQLWTFQLQSGQTAGAALLERTLGHPGYHVYLRIKVAGLYGSVREIGSRYNFVRITFSLPVPLPGGGAMAVVAPEGYSLLASGFWRENMPPLTRLLATSPGEVGYNPLALNVSVPSGLLADRFYAFRFGVENPSEQLGSDDRPWQLWCLGPGRTVLAANVDVRAFRLEARFQAAALLPSTVLPLASPNLVEFQLVLGSSPLEVTRSDRARLELTLPAAYSLAQGPDRPSICRLHVLLLGPAEDASAVPGQVVTPLPSSSLCTAISPRHLVIEVFETLALGRAYHFSVALENPMEEREAGSWMISTQRNGALLHLAAETPNFALTPEPDFRLSASDAAKGAVQALRAELRPRRHVRGHSAIELWPPQGFNLSCRHAAGAQNDSGALALMPLDTTCAVQDGILRLELPPPTAYAPYAPALLAGQDYAFAALCANPLEGAGLGFQLRLVEERSVPPRVLELRAGLGPRALAEPLELLRLGTEEVLTLGQDVQLTVRFRAPAGYSAAGPVRALLLEGPAGARLSRGVSSPCEGFSSRMERAGDVALPESVCSGASGSGVLIQMQEPLPLQGAGGQGLTYVFELLVPALEREPLVDSFLLALLPGPGGAPIFSGSAEGFAGRVEGLPPQESPPAPDLDTAAPVDSELPPLSTVQREASAGPRACRPAAAVAAAAAAALAAARGGA